MTSFDDYQEFTESTVVYSTRTELDALTYCGLGLAGEAGETADKIKKILRGDKPFNDEAREAIAFELGDVLYYLTRIGVTIGYNLEQIAHMNENKLTSRKERGMLKGDGDNR